MPRIHQLEEKYSRQDFLREILRKLADRYGDTSVRALAQEIGVCQSTMNVKLRHRQTSLDVGELRKIVPVLHPDPGTVLALVGYKPDEVRRFVENYTVRKKGDGI